MIDYCELTDAQAEAALEDYVRTLPGLVQRLRVRMTREGGPLLDDTVNSLGPLGPWFLDQIRAEREDWLAGVPVWWSQTPTRDDVPEGLPFTAGHRLLHGNPGEDGTCDRGRLSSVQRDLGLRGRRTRRYPP